MTDTRSHHLARGVAIDRTAESATAVLRDWDVHITTILDDQGDVRVRAHDPRTLNAGVTMLRDNAHRALSAHRYPPVPSSRPMRRAYRSVGMALAGAVAMLTLSGAGLAADLYTLPGWLLPATVDASPVTDTPIPRYSLGDTPAQRRTPVSGPVPALPSVLVPVTQHVQHIPPADQPAAAQPAKQLEGAEAASPTLGRMVVATVAALIGNPRLDEIVPAVSGPVEMVTEMTEPVTEPIINDRPLRRPRKSK